MNVEEREVKSDRSSHIPLVLLSCLCLLLSLPIMVTLYVDRYNRIDNGANECMYVYAYRSRITIIINTDLPLGYY